MKRTEPPGEIDHAPRCDKCQQLCVPNQSKTAENSGRYFWACRKTPECKGFVRWMLQPPVKRTPSPEKTTSPSKKKATPPKQMRTLDMWVRKDASQPISLSDAVASSASAKVAAATTLRRPEPLEIIKPSTPTKLPTKLPTTPTKLPTTPTKFDLPVLNRLRFEEGATASSSSSSSSSSQTTSQDHNRPILPSYKESMAKAHKAAERDERYAFLDDVRDKEKRRPGDEGYDGRTLYVPPTALERLSDFERQYWKVKSEHYDKVVLYKKGKFYEMYEKDADLAVQYLNLKMSGDNARGHMRMTGVPEGSFDMVAAKLVALGLKVVRVDQAESKVARDRRVSADGGGGSEIMQRKVAAVLSPGTLTDDAHMDGVAAAYLMAIKQHERGGGGPEFGVCLVDASTGQFLVGQISDDNECSQLETLLLQRRPKEVLFERGALSPGVMRLMRALLSFPTFTPRAPGAEFVDDAAARALLDGDAAFAGAWPDELGPLARGAMPAALEALAACTLYLREMHLDRDLLSARRFHVFSSVDELGRAMVLDGKALSNLELFYNSTDGSRHGTLYAMLDHASSPLGKRRLREWLCRPPRAVPDIAARQRAVAHLVEHVGLLGDLSKALAALPDLERLVARVHSGSCRAPVFVNTLVGFEKSVEVCEMLQRDAAALPPLLAALAGSRDAPLRGFLDEFRTYFSLEDAATAGYIVPYPGQDAEADRLARGVADVKTQLDDELERVRVELGVSTREISYVDVGKEHHVVQVKSSALRGPLPSSVVLRGAANKTFSRFVTSEVAVLARRLEEAEEDRNVYVRGLLQEQMARFDARRQHWLEACDRMARLDALCALAAASATMDEPRCVPDVYEAGDDATAECDFEQLRHPYLAVGRAGSAAIPNDMRLGGGGDGKPVVLLTGPNMGGKTTLLRTVCVATILAQLGCFVPARRARLAAVDRIFTRIGANDNIVGGQSTFMVELLETASILKHATARSLVILDELGRGTSTFDGYAIAHAVVEHLARVRCRALFATHYHMLTDEFANSPCVSLQHMACHVDGANVTFLYQLRDGACPSSYGMNVARMAGIPEPIVLHAEAVAAYFERCVQHNAVAALDPAALAELSRAADSADAVPSLHALSAGRAINLPLDSRAVDLWRAASAAVRGLSPAAISDDDCHAIIQIWNNARKID